jgi:hypothetical protein
MKSETHDETLSLLAMSEIERLDSIFMSNTAKEARNLQT